MGEKTELMTVDNICNRVYIIRGQQVMLDYDLADIYGYEVKRILEILLYIKDRNLKQMQHTQIFITAVVNDFATQYPPLHIKPNPDCHDRWIVIDYGLSTKCAYHCGASSKDAGKKLCAINKIENTGVLHPVIDGLLLGTDKTI